jgi:hypothetical protein
LAFVLFDSGGASSLALAPLRKYLLPPTILAWECWRSSPTLGLRTGTAPRSEDIEKLKQRWPLLDYLRQQNWEASPAGHGSPEFVGLCPLHPETLPSFYVNARKNLFYCHGCGQGGDLIRFVELSRHLSFRPKPRLSPPAKRSCCRLGRRA